MEPGDGLWIRPQLDLDARVQIPRDRLAEHPVEPRTAAQIVKDELLLDGNARLNLATFVTTWMEPEAHILIAACLDKNLVDKDEYPQSAEIENRCVRILADLWHADGQGPDAVGTSTTGSSEACMLGGLALLRRWRKRRGDGPRPNLVMGANVQVVWEKFCRYWDVEPRLVPVGDGTTHLVPDRAVAHCDEDTIGVVAILGSTFDGTYEPVAEIAAALDRLQAERGIDVPVHVDAASGGFIAPFLDAHLHWDFRVPRVQSINASGHKYGLVFPGVGWVVFRGRDALPSELVFDVDYLGGELPTYGLNFSRPAAQVIAQYYMLVRLGRAGFRRVQQDCRDVAKWLAEAVGELSEFTLLSHGDELPVVAFSRTTDGDDWSVYDVSERLRVFGWIVPAYPMPTGMEDTHVLRVVVRNGFTRDMAGLFVDDLRRVLHRLCEAGGDHVGMGGKRTGFHH
jgi:glutamate decarboxylase